jgi:hypothetical protein
VEGGAATVEWSDGAMGKRRWQEERKRHGDEQERYLADTMKE